MNMTGHMSALISYLVWVQSKVRIQKLSSVIIRVSFIDLIGRVPNLNIHGSVCHSVVLEALGTADRQNQK